MITIKSFCLLTYSYILETTIDCNIGASVRGEVQENYNGKVFIQNSILQIHHTAHYVLTVYMFIQLS